MPDGKQRLPSMTAICFTGLLASPVCGAARHAGRSTVQQSRIQRLLLFGQPVLYDSFPFHLRGTRRLFWRTVHDGLVEALSALMGRRLLALRHGVRGQSARHAARQLPGSSASRRSGGTRTNKTARTNCLRGRKWFKVLPRHNTRHMPDT